MVRGGRQKKMVGEDSNVLKLEIITAELSPEGKKIEKDIIWHKLRINGKLIANLELQILTDGEFL